MFQPLDVTITGDDLVTLLVVLFIGVCAVLFVQWILSKF